MNNEWMVIKENSQHTSNANARTYREKTKYKKNKDCLYSTGIIYERVEGNMLPKKGTKTHNP